MYHQGLHDDFVKPVIMDDFYDVYHIYNIRHPQRDKLKAYLAEHGVGTEIHYPVPPYRQKALQGMFDSRCLPDNRTDSRYHPEPADFDLPFD